MIITCKGTWVWSITAIYDTASLSTRCSKYPDSNPKTPQKGSILFMGDNNTQKIMTYNETRLIVAISDHELHPEIIGYKLFVWRLIAFWHIYFQIKQLLEPRFLIYIKKSPFRNNEIRYCYYKACLLKTKKHSP